MRKLLTLVAALTLASGPVASAQKPGAPRDRATVLIFLSTECPYSNRYAPEILRLYKKFAAEGVRFWLVYPGRSDSPAKIADHLKEFSLPDVVLRDRSNVFLKTARPAVTPEAVVFDGSRKIAYQGRIDDRFVELMVERPAPTTHDLEDALAAILSGRTIATARTTAVGCSIADLR